MSQNIRFQRYIEPIGIGKHTDNYRGNFSMEKVYLYDDCLGKAEDATNWWDEHLDGTGDTFAQYSTTTTAAANGMVRLTTGSGDNEETIVNYGCLSWYGDQNCVVEARIRINDVSGVCLFFGLADAVGEMSFDYKDGTLTSTATDGVGFLVDADKAASSIYCVGCKADTDETAVDSGTDWGDTEWKVLRVECATDGATFWLDGAQVGYMDASQEGGNGLVITFSVENRDAAADTVDIDYIKAWQDRS